MFDVILYCLFLVAGCVCASKEFAKLDKISNHVDIHAWSFYLQPFHSQTILADNEDLKLPLPFTVTMKLPIVDYQEYGKKFQYYLYQSNDDLMYQINVGQYYAHEPSYAKQSTFRDMFQFTFDSDSIKNMEHALLLNKGILHIYISCVVYSGTTTAKTNSSTALF